jgi:hypothetical protein
MSGFIANIVDYLSLGFQLWALANNGTFERHPVPTVWPLIRGVKHCVMLVAAVIMLIVA